MSSEKMGVFLREVSNWTWEDFVRAEHDPKYTSNNAMIFALVRACAMQKMEAIKMALNRIDGKLKTPIKIEAPKIFYLFPNAKPPTVFAAVTDDPNTTNEIKPVVGELIAAPEEPTLEENDLPSLSLRQTLTKLSDLPREFPEAIVAYALQVEQWVKNGGDLPDENPMVKSVVASHLLILAASRDMTALNEVFDQIDGKLAETIQIVGEDLYITSYANVAPEGAYINKDGTLEIEAVQAQLMWAQKLGAVLPNA